MVGWIPGMSGPLPRAGLVVLAGRSLETPTLGHQVSCLLFRHPAIRTTAVRVQAMSFVALDAVCMSYRNISGYHENNLTCC
jgi:hypothetical protein